MAEPVLQAIGLRRDFGDFVAVDSVDFEVPRGGSLAIVGESGSGKSTLANMIVGLCAPTAGTIIACGSYLQVLSHAMYPDDLKPY